MASASTARPAQEADDRAKRRRVEPAPVAVRVPYPTLQSFSSRTRAIMLLASFEAAHEVCYAGGGLVLTSGDQVLLGSVEELLLVLDELRTSFDVPGVASKLLCRILAQWLLLPERSGTPAWIAARCVGHVVEVDAALVTEAWLDHPSALVDAEEVTKLLTLPTFVGLLARLATMPRTPKRTDAGLRFLVAWLHAHPEATTSDEVIERHARHLLEGSRCEVYDLSRYVDSPSRLLLKLLLGALYRREIVPPDA